jgi:diacylglycerol O-acyltransferase / wax synthase
MHLYKKELFCKVWPKPPDDVTLADPHEATDAMIDAVTEIRRAAGLSEHLSTLDAALPLAAAAS